MRTPTPFHPLRLHSRTPTTAATTTSDLFSVQFKVVLRSVESRYVRHPVSDKSPTLPRQRCSVDGAAEPRVRRAATVYQLSPCLTFSLRSVAGGSRPGPATWARSRSHAATRPGPSAWGIPASGRGYLGTPCSTCTACTRVNRQHCLAGL